MLATNILSGMVMPASAASVVTLASTSATKPATPSGVKVSVSYPSKTKATVKVSWNKVSGTSGYQVKSIAAMTMDDILALDGISVSDISLINELQKAIKSNNVIAFFSSTDQ